MNRAARLALLAAPLLVASCAAHTVRIADLKNGPGRYEHKTVSVAGVVTSSWSLPIAPLQVYDVNDGTGEIVVLSRSTHVLSTGARVEVKGRVNEVASFGTRSFGLHLEERDRKIR